MRRFSFQKGIFLLARHHHLHKRTGTPLLLSSTIRFHGTLSSTKQGARMASADISEKAQPFSALIKASSLIVAVLYLAGFSYRWGYYYNFGVQHLVFNLSFQSILTASMEMIRLPRNLLITTVSLVGILLLRNPLAISALQRAGRWIVPERCGGWSQRLPNRWRWRIRL